MKARNSRRGPPEGTKRTIRVDVQYDGTEFSGWQRQARHLTVQQVLEEALSKVAAEKVTLLGASRTDAGVHAHQQVASFSLKASRTPAAAFRRGTNPLLPESIRVTKAEEVDLLFHSSLDVQEKTYRYFLDVFPDPLLFLRRYAWHVRPALDRDALDAAARHLVGTQDFSAFRTGPAETKSAVRTIRRAVWKEGPLGLLCFEVTANGFLKHMVRNVVGTLVEIGRGKRDAGDIPEILRSRQRTRAGSTAPPHGLFLWSVRYPENSFSLCPGPRVHGSPSAGGAE